MELVQGILALLGVGSFVGLTALFMKIRDYMQGAKHYFWRGDRLARKNKHEEAVRWYDKALRKDPGYIEALERSVGSHLGSQRLPKQIYPQAIEFLESRTRSIDDTMRLIEIHQKRCEAEPDELEHRHSLRECHMFLEEHMEAYEMYKSLARWYAWRARCLADDAARYDEAQQDIDAALLIDPRCALVHYAHGYLLGVQGEHQKAVDACTEAIRLKPDFALVYYNRGNTYGNLGKHDLAIEDYTKAIELDPKFAKTYNNRGVSYNKLGKYDLAIEDYTKAIALNPKYAKAYNNRGVRYEKLGKYDLAIEDYTKAIELDPKYAKAYHNRAITYDEMGKHDLAKADRKKAAELKAAQGKNP